MGNNPSTPKSGSATPSSAHDSPRQHQKRDTRHPMPVQNHRVAAPPEPSLAQAQGSTVINRSKGSQSRPVSAFNASSPSSSSTHSAIPSRPADNTTTKKPEPDPEPSKPVAVPKAQPPPPAEPSSPSSPFSDPNDPVSMPLGSVQDMSYLTRPPRLPLPIEEEEHTPGSPIIAPADIGEPVDSVDNLDAEGLPRRSSALSTTTVDEEDAEELRVDKTRPTVPTRLEWLRGGEKVYVTGTIFQWNRKQRLHPVEGRPGVFATTINILPGTHHIRFLVDNNMQTSPDLPTTVDFGNNLVNYIEINPDDVPPVPAEASAAAPDQDEKTLAERSASQASSSSKPPRERPVVPAERYSYDIPRYLVDFDQPEDTPLYQSAVGAIEKLPTPPSLPGFLGKPILNAAVLIKDDNSVLNMPNHTVLNHLATSSIKNNVLAVSATTRYKSKYVTTIIYKPTDG